MRLDEIEMVLRLIEIMEENGLNNYHQIKVKKYLSEEKKRIDEFSKWLDTIKPLRGFWEKD